VVSAHQNVLFQMCRHVYVLVPGIRTPRTVSVGEWRAATEPLLHGQLQRREQ